MNKINVKLGELDEGALQERFEYEMKKVIENISDPNTDFKKKRKITIDLEITTDEYRDQIYIEHEVKSKLTPREKRTTKALINVDMEGNVIANELKSGEKGQMYFDADDSTLKDDTGKPVEQIESESKDTAILDFRNKNKATN